ncbi:hypothetical protein HOY82DRAFT_595047 [Tuber indicum]|nr:hypothetical protein HOY82DRAFT_595047 [Tuber indicum]
MKVMTMVGRRNNRVTHDGKRELITDLETICGDGTLIAPFLIFKAKAGHSMGWYASLDNPDIPLAYSDKGWTDDFLDRYSSYINWDFHVAVFCPLKHFYGLAVDDFSHHQGGGIHKDDLRVAAQANLQIAEECRRVDQQKAISIAQMVDRHRLTTARVIDSAEAMHLYQIRENRILSDFTNAFTSPSLTTTCNYPPGFSVRRKPTLNVGQEDLGLNLSL